MITITELRELGHDNVADLAIEYSKKNDYGKESIDISIMFTWNDTDEGRDFWESIYRRNFERAYELHPHLLELKKELVFDSENYSSFKDICDCLNIELTTHRNNIMDSMYDADYSKDVNNAIVDIEILIDILKEYKKELLNIKKNN